MLDFNKHIGILGTYQNVMDSRQFIANAPWLTPNCRVIEKEKDPR